MKKPAWIVVGVVVTLPGLLALACLGVRGRSS
jgi:hypothetical protein